MRPKPMRPSISIQAKTWLRIEMSARVEPVAMSFGSSSTGSFRSESSRLSSDMIDLLRGGAGGAGRDRGSGGDLDFHSLGEAVGSLDHDLLSWRDAGQDLDASVSRAYAELERPHPCLGAVDHVGHEAALAGHHRRLRHDHRVGLRLRGEIDFREE